MDFTPIIDQAVGMLWYLIPAAILIAIMKSAWFKGAVFFKVVGTIFFLSSRLQR